MSAYLLLFMSSSLSPFFIHFYTVGKARITTMVKRNPKITAFLCPTKLITSNGKVELLPKFWKLAIMLTYMPENFDSLKLFTIMLFRKNCEFDKICNHKIDIEIGTILLKFMKNINAIEINLTAKIILVR